MKQIINVISRKIKIVIHVRSVAQPSRTPTTRCKDKFDDVGAQAVELSRKVITVLICCKLSHTIQENFSPVRV